MPSKSSPPSSPDRSRTARVIRTPWGVMPNGSPVDAYTLTNANGIEVCVLTLGGIIASLRTPDRDGAMDDIVLGVSTVTAYLTRSPYFGAIVGRSANRIARGQLTIGAQRYALPINDGPNHLHGGVSGFDKKNWTGKILKSDDGVAVRLSLVSADGEEGYPGRLNVTVRYLLTDDNRLMVDYTATTLRPTVVNLSQHSYFNLAGTRQADILGHELTLECDAFTPVDATLIPTGEIAPVDGTPFDFRTATPIGARIGDAHPQLEVGGGYDHNFVVRRVAAGLQPAAFVREPLTGRTLAVATTEPGMQLYTGNALDGSVIGKQGAPYGPRSGFCLETQHFPDAPNQPSFPSTVLQPDGRYRSRTVFTFGVDR